MGDELQWRSWFTDDYLQHLILFSFGQALLSTVLSIFGLLLLSRALFHQSLSGKKLVLKLMSLTFVLPVLMAIFGLIGIYGSSGWLAKFANLFGHREDIFTGSRVFILIAHLFFNIPLAAQLFLQSLQSITYQQRQLAAQLQFTRLAIR